MERYSGSSEGKASSVKRSLVDHGTLFEIYILTQTSAVQVVTSANKVPSILNVESDVEHGRMRRVLNHAFSDKAMREQEPLIQEYIDLLMKSLHQAAEEGPQNMVAWYQFVSVDIIGM